MKTQANTMPVNYQLGKVYTIVNDQDDIIYVGSTAQPRLSSRWSSHKRDSTDINRTSGIYTAMRTLGVDHFRIVLHHVFPCNSKDELVAEEFKTLDAILAAGKSVYNNMIAGKHDAATKSKMSAANSGKKATDATKKKLSDAHFGFGCIGLATIRGCQAWRFQWWENGTQQCKSFSCKKYGEYGALWRAEQARREQYPEWGNEEDLICDDFGEIEWEI